MVTVEEQLHALLHRLEAGPGVESKIDFNWVSINETYRESNSSDFVDGSSTIRSWISGKTRGTTVGPLT